jgi:hydrogenase expression/formation protein HypC
MCLAIPGQVVELRNIEPPFSSALVDFNGIRREVSVACVPEVAEGDYVMVHAGIAIARVDAVEAARVLADLEEIELELVASIDDQEPTAGKVAWP